MCFAAFVLPAFAHAPVYTATGGTPWECQQSDGTFVSKHAAEREALERCSKEYELTGEMHRVVMVAPIRVEGQGVVCEPTAGEPPPPPPPLGSIRLTWDEVTRYVDNTPIAPGDLTAYRIYETQPASAFIVEVPGTETMVVINDLPPENYCWRATAVANVHHDGAVTSVESTPGSNTACATIN